MWLDMLHLFFFEFFSFSFDFMYSILIVTELSRYNQKNKLFLLHSKMYHFLMSKNWMAPSGLPRPQPHGVLRSPQWSSIDKVLGGICSRPFF